MEIDPAFGARSLVLRREMGPVAGNEILNVVGNGVCCLSFAGLGFPCWTASLFVKGRSEKGGNARVQSC